MRAQLLVVAVLGVLLSGCATVDGVPPQSRSDRQAEAGPSRESSSALESLPGLASVARGEVVFQAPDGAIHAVRSDGSGERAVAGAPPRLSDVSGPAIVLAWLPEQAIIACVADDTPPDVANIEYASYPIYLAGLVSAKVTRIGGKTSGPVATSLSADNLEASFSQDGRNLVYYDSENWGWYAADAATGLARDLAPGESVDGDDPRGLRALWPQLPASLRTRAVAVSPSARLVLTQRRSKDDEQVTYAVFDRRKGTSSDLFTLRFGGPDGLVHGAAFSPDSRSLVFEFVEPGASDGAPSRDHSIQVMSVDGGPRTEIARGTAPTFWPGD